MVTLLMTRAREASDRFLALLPAETRADLRVIHSPLIETVPLDVELSLAGVRGVIFTSANGVSAAARLTERRDLPAWCVGGATTAAARAHRWGAECVGRDADELVRTLIARRPEDPLSHLRGVHARGDIAARLSAAGIETREAVVYDQRLLPLTPQAVQALAGADPVIVPLFSPRAARHFASLATGRAPLYLAAMSHAVAEPVSSLNFNTLKVSKAPTAQTMAQAVTSLVARAGRVVGGSDED
ncbi:uroporphyrinogen-III synthase [Jhaorihella thermophila]|nr:uroporphyrinogen-III synthase [Jhaorihella thermophila]